ncbi:MAG: hypothetical protein MUC88_24775 [Planctomycetes bacterium]|nr:hypothetical protein [Planctomycetota bacterium]
MVVAVLSVLLALLLPALAGARTRAKCLTCQGHLKQIALGYLCYLEDWGGQFYGAAGVPNPNSTFGGWAGTVSKVAHRPVNGSLGLPSDDAGEGQATVFRCPADRDALGTRDGSYYRDRGNSYQASLIVVAPDRLLTSLPERWGAINQEILAYGRPERDRVFQPQRLAWIGDFFWTVQLDPLSTRCTGWHGRRHYHNVAFFDGHVAFTEIIRGMYDVDGSYRMQPHREADPRIRELQRHELCKCEKKLQP